MAQDLVDEFLRVWAKNNNPNESNSRSVYYFGYNQRAWLAAHAVVVKQ